MAKWKAIGTCYVDKVFYKPGDVFEWDGPQGKAFVPYEELPAESDFQPALKPSEPIASYPSGIFKKCWYPAVEVYQNDVDADGNAMQKFILHDGSRDGRFPVERVGPPLDLSDPQTLMDQWKTLNKRPDDGAGD